MTVIDVILVVAFAFTIALCLGSKAYEAKKRKGVM